VQIAKSPRHESWTWLPVSARCPADAATRSSFVSLPRSTTIGGTDQSPGGSCVARLRVNGGDVRDFAIELTDRPGELGRVATALSR
jgi:hypothetical protein